VFSLVADEVCSRLSRRPIFVSAGNGESMTTFVLVHGAWHGGWCWKYVAQPLRGAGHDVYTPTLTGLGERCHLLTPDVGLETHIQDIVNLFEFEDLRDVVLVGHSYGGMVITGVVDRVPNRVGHLVYLDAYVPGDGQSLLDISGPRPEFGTDWFIEPFDTFGVESAGEATLAWLESRLTRQPARAMSDRGRLSLGLEEQSFSRTYLLAAGQPRLAFPATATRLRENAAWKVIELATGHDMMVTMPREVAEILLEVAE
jgi:pimeloyl-ACP methyl ester carboxylesterase